MNTTTTRFDAGKVLRDSYLAALGVGQMAISKGREMSGSAIGFARGGRKSLDETVRDLVRRGEKLEESVRQSDLARRALGQTRYARRQASAAGKQTRVAAITVRDSMSALPRPARPASKPRPKSPARRGPAAARRGKPTSRSTARKAG